MKDVSKKPTQTNNTLVLGGNGKTGSRVAERLKKRGVPVRIGSRASEPPFDWEDQATWKAVLMVSLLTYLFTTVLDGRNAQLADGIQPGSVRC